MVDFVTSGIQEPTRNDVVSVPNSTTLVSPSRNEENPRKDILIRNTSTDPTYIITVNLGLSSPVAGAGTVLRQYESFMLSQDAGPRIFQGSITAICAVAGPGTLSVMER